MKKLLVITLSLMMVFAFTACQDDAADLRDDNDVVENNDNNMVGDNDVVDDPEIGNDNDEIGDDEIIDEDDDMTNDFAEDTMITSVYTRRIDDDFIEIGENDNLERYRLTDDLRTRFEELDLTEGDRVNFKYRTNEEGEREIVDIDILE